MRLRAPVPAVAFVGGLLLFAVAASPIISLVSPVDAQGGAPVFDSSADYTRSIDENKGPYDTSGGGTPSQGDRVLIGDPVTATGAGVTYTLDNGGSSDFGIDFFSGQLMVGNPLDYEEKSSHTVTVIATNDSGTARQDVTINVNNLDEPGTVTLMWKPSGSDVEFEAKLSDGDVITGTTTWQWSESDSQNGAYTDISGATSATYTNSSDHEYLKATATYTDSHGAGKTEYATVQAERPSKFPTGYELEFGVNTSGGYACPHSHTGANYNNQDADICRSISKNATPEDDIYYPASVKYTHATERDRYPSGGDISYSLSGDDAAKFDIDPTSGALFPKGTHQYNSPGPDEVFLVTITATHPSGGNDGSDSVDIALKPSGSNHNPVVQGPQDIHYPENGTWQVARYTADFSHPDQTVGWIIGVEPGGGDGDFFDIDDDGVLFFTQRPDYDNGQREFNFSIQAYATNGPRGSTHYSVRVTVYNVDEDLEIRGPTVIDFPENSTNAIHTYTATGTEGSLTWMLEGQDKQWFSLSSSGTLSFKNTPDYESPFDSSDPPRDQNDYLLSITVMDDNGTTNTADDDSSKIESVRVMVTDVNETFTITGPSTVSYAENRDDAVATYTVTDDPEKGSINWDLSGDDAGDFDIDYLGELTFSVQPDFDDPADENTNNEYFITIEGRDGENLVEKDVTVRVTDTNDPPEFDAGLTTTFDVDENTAAGANIGSPLTATDPEQTSLSYSLDTTDGAAFAIDGNGQLKTKAALNYEVKNSYSVTVTVSDTGNSSDTIDVTITVNDVNETPTFDEGSSTTRSIPENTNSGVDIGAPVSATDPDNENGANGDTLAYTLGGTDAASFGFNTSTGQIETSAALDRETKSSYSVTVTVRDGRDANGDSDTAEDDTITVTINVTGENDPPVFTAATASREVPENSPAGTKVGSPVTATDEDNPSLTYTLEGTDKDSFTIDNSGQIKTKTGVTYDYESAKTTYAVTVKASDGNSSDTIDVTIDLTNVNEPPSFPSASTTRSVSENAGAGENIGAPVQATDPDAGDSPSYALTGSDDDASFDIGASDGQLKTKSGVDYGSKSRYTVTITATDGGSLTDEITVTISSTEVNDPPVFDDGSLVTELDLEENTASNVNIGAAITATDEDNNTLTYTLEGDDASSFDVGSNGQIKTRTGVTYDYEDPGDTDNDRAYELTVKADDNNGGTDTIDVTITLVNVDEAGTIAFNATQPKAGTPLAATLTDPDGSVSGETWKWSMAPTATGTFTTISGETSDSYTPAATDVGKYLKVEVSYTDPEDSGKNAEATTAAVIAANTPPSFPGGNNPTPVTMSVDENSEAGTVVGTLEATESDTGDTLTYSLDGEAAEITAFNAAFSLDTSTGEITVLADDSLDHEDTSSYTFDVDVSDGKNAANVSDSEVDATVAVTIKVADVNEPPAFNDTPNTRTIAENTGAGLPVGDPFTATDPDEGTTLTYVLGGSDKDSFTIDSSGQIKTKTGVTYNHEAKETYSVTVTVHDGKDQHGNPSTVADDTVSVTITVTDQDEPGTVTFSNQTPQARTELTAALEDPDGVTGTTTWQWSISSTAGGTFSPITNATNASYTPVDDDAGKYLRAKATYNDGFGQGKMAQADVPNAVTAFHNPNANPVFPGTTPSSLSVAENTPPGRNIESPVTATDSDQGDTLTYSIDTASQDVFTIVPGIGQIQTRGDLDYETTSSYSVTITATDPGIATGTTTITIKVTDVAEPPGKPDAPVLAANGHDSLAADWTAPTNTGPQITSYTFSHRRHDVQGWTTQTIPSLNSDPPPTTLSMTTLLPETTYFARVQATNDEGTGDWSDEGEGTTEAKLEADWSDLTVDYSAATYSVTEGGTVTITVRLSSEADRKFNLPITVTAGTAETGDYAVNGLDGSNNLAFVPGESSKTFTITANADADTDDETLTLGFGTTLPTKLTLGTTTPTATITITDDAARSNNPPPPQGQNPAVRFSSSTYTVNEGGSATITVQMSPALSQAVTIPVTVTDRTAESGDYTVSASSVTFSSGDASQRITVSANGDDDTDAETLTLGFGTLPDGVASGSPSSATVTINDDDTPVVGPPQRQNLTVRFSAPTYTVNEGETATITVQMSPAPGHSVTIPVTATGGTAEPGDYTVSASSVTFSSRDASQRITVSANQDADTDAETVSLSFGTLPSGVSAGNPSTATLTINDDDTPVLGLPLKSLSVRYSAARYTVTEGETATITVRLSSEADRSVRVPVNVAAGTAEPNDYSVSASGVTFGTGATRRTFTITAEQDADQEAESLSLSFGPLPNQVSTVSPFTATLTINDDDAPVVNNQPPPRRRSGLTRRGSRGSNGPRLSNEQRPPVFMEGPSTTRWIPENTLIGVNIGFPVWATDPNQDPLTYTLTGGDRTSFAVDPSTGQLSTSAPLDYETKADYSVTMVVSDGRGGKDSIVVLIAVTDVNEIAYDPATQAVALVTVEDGASLTTPDGSGSVVFPAATRSVPYYARIGQGSSDCARDAPEGDLHVYATADIFDMAGNPLEDLTLEQPVTILLRVNAADLGGLERVLLIHEHGGFRAYTRADSSEDWIEVDFTLVSSDTGAITAFITGIREFNCFVVVVDASVLPAPVVQAIAAAAPTPTPVPETPSQAAPVAPTPAPPAAVAVQDPPTYPPVAQSEGADDPFGPEAPLFTFRNIVDFAMGIPLWLIVLLAIAAAVWAAILRAYVVWRRNHPPPPRYRNSKPQLGRDLLTPGG